MLQLMLQRSKPVPIMLHADLPGPGAWLYNRLEALQPQQEVQGYAVESRLEGKMAKHLFHNFLRVVKRLKAPSELGESGMEQLLSPEEHQKWLEHEKAVVEEHLEQLRRGFIRNQDFAGDEMGDGVDAAIGRDEETGAKADEQQDVEKPAVKTEN
ncbi:hypothetical protein B9Z55_029070 [Caenorhabditis nigoni]|nr:hypothetical protein B9Z55_029070 [Caenorhabditis nigoni]